MELGLQNSALARTSDLGAIMSKMTMKSTHTRLAYVLMASVAMPTFAIAQQIKIEEIVVTARKRDESLLEIPLSVSAFSQEMLDRAGIDNAQDLSDFVSGLDFRSTSTSSGRATPDIRFRGMIQQIISPTTQVGALFWDGSYVGGGGGFVPLGDLETVEVIKGPQAAYFGRNTFSGAINYIPKRPGDEWEGKMSVSFSPSDHNEVNINGAVGGPITEKVGVRVWGGYDRDGGDYSFDDGQPFGQTRDRSLSGMLTFNPSDDLRFKFSGYQVRADDTTFNAAVLSREAPGSCQKTFAGTLLNAATGQRTPYTFDLRTLRINIFCDRLPEVINPEFPISRYPTAAQLSNGATGGFAGLSNINPRSEKYGIIRKPDGGLGGFHQTYRLQFGAEYDVGDHTLTATVSRANTGTTTRIDAFNGASNVPNTQLVFAIGNEIAIREFYYEARLSSPQDQRLRYNVGVSDYNQHYYAFVDPSRPFPIDRQRNTTFAVFASADYDILDNLTLSAEGRYSKETNIAIENGDPRLKCGLLYICDQKNDFKDVIPRFILNYKPYDGTTLYASYSYSSLLGVATQAAFISSIAPNIIPPSQVAALGNFTPPQKNVQYEIGWKQKGDTWNATLALYDTDWKNQPFAALIFVPGGAGTSAYRGPGHSVYRGIDFEGNWQATDWLLLSGQLGYNDGKMKTFSSRGTLEQVVLNSGTSSVVADGNPIRYNIKWTGSFSPTIQGEIGERQWYVRSDVVYTGKSYADYSNFNTIGSSKKVNLRAGIDVREGTLIEVYGTNIFQDKQLPSGSTTTTAVNNNREVVLPIINRRDIGVKVTAKF